MHVVLLELVIDPTCALVFEAEPSEGDAMRRPPRRVDEPLFGSRQIGAAILQGVAVLAAVFAVYLWVLDRAPAADQARGAAFVALVTGILSLALADSMSAGKIFARHRLPYWLIAGAITAVLGLMMWAKPVAAIFEVARPPGPVLATSVLAGLASGVWVILTRRLWRPGASEGDSSRR